MQEHSASASLWGCELKWKEPPFLAEHHLSASLWGCELKCPGLSRVWGRLSVSLLVRLWVEILHGGQPMENSRSASLWGCELKLFRSLGYYGWETVSLLVRLWVEMKTFNWCCKVCSVSLLVRLWVEIPGTMTRWFGVKSASLWGCELKWKLLTDAVRSVPSASLWGCELKCWSGCFSSFISRQPPCEAVSWNDQDIF